MSLVEVQGITGWFIIGFLLVIFVYDAWAIAKAGTKASISYKIIMEWSRKYPAFTFLVGFIMGHLFWPLSTCV